MTLPASDTTSRKDDKGTRFCFTVNTHDDDPEGHDLQRSIDDIEDLFRRGLVVYAIGSWERGGTTNRLHIQGWVILKKQSRVGWFIGRVHRAYAEVQRATNDDDAYEYAYDPTKDGWIGKAFEFGERPSKGQGRRSDLAEIDTEIAEGRLSTFRDVNDLNPSVTARHPNWVNWRLEEAARDELMSSDRYSAPYQPKIWQYWLNRYLNELPADERKIIFVVDKLGHAGKTRFCYEFKRSSELRVQLMRPGRAADMGDALQIRTEVLFIDVPRSRTEYIKHVYSFMEEAKDGEVNSPKFHSRYKPLPRCHVVMFTNSDVDTTGEKGGYYPGTRPGEPDLSVPGIPPLSHDRYAIWEIDDELRSRWDPCIPPWNNTCPPFISYDERMSPIEYNPPLVVNSGPAYNGDMAGDGPDYDLTVSGLTRSGELSTWLPVLTVVINQSSGYPRWMLETLGAVSDDWYVYDMSHSDTYNAQDAYRRNVSNLPIEVLELCNDFNDLFEYADDWFRYLETHFNYMWSERTGPDALNAMIEDDEDSFSVLTMTNVLEIPVAMRSLLHNRSQFTILVNLVVVTVDTDGMTRHHPIHAAAA